MKEKTITDEQLAITEMVGEAIPTAIPDANIAAMEKPVPVTLDRLKALYQACHTQNNLNAWAIVALKWAEGANDEMEQKDSMLTMLHRLYDNCAEIRDIHGNPLRYEIDVMDYEALERTLYGEK